MESTINASNTTGNEPTSIPKFRYSTTSLDDTKPEFRLLELFPPDPGAGDYDSDLICRIFVTNVTNPLKPFRALSYVWGDDTKTHEILVRRDVSDKRSSIMRGHDGEAEKDYLRIHLTKSLDTALRNLRRMMMSAGDGEEMVLWIDQICINQDDTVEKAHQVGLMGRIYSSAKEVLVWLGPEDPENNSDGVMQGFRKVGQASRDLGVEQFFTRENHARLVRAMNNFDPEDEFTKQYQTLVVKQAAETFPALVKGMLAFFERPWFGRAWTVQEFCLCPETVFVCGRERMPAELLHLALMAFQNSYTLENMPAYTTDQGLGLDEVDRLMEPPSTRLFHCRTRRLKYQRGVEGATGDGLLVLLKKLYVGRNFTQAKEHRDRIYSLFGLAVDVEELNIQPEYSGMRDDRVLARILTDAARAMITKGKHRRIETMCYSQPPKISGAADYLPSWVPDWRSGLKPSFYEIIEAAGEHVFAACGSLLDVEPVPASDGDDPNVLGLGGYLVGTIEAVTPGEPWTPTRHEAERFFRYMDDLGELLRRAVEKDNLDPEQAFHTKERRDESLWRVPIGDLFWTPEKDKHRAGAELAGEWFKKYKEAMTLVAKVNLEGDPAVQWQMLEEYKFVEKKNNNELIYYSSMEYTEGKKPFLTRNGYLGMGPAEAREGDVVVVFCGGRIPFVLRPVDSDEIQGIQGDHEQRFQLVGEAFCDGIMDGEIVSRTERRNFFLV